MQRKRLPLLKSLYLQPHGCWYFRLRNKHGYSYYVSRQGYIIRMVNNIALVCYQALLISNLRPPLLICQDKVERNRDEMLSNRCVFRDFTQGQALSQFKSDAQTYMMESLVMETAQ